MPWGMLTACEPSDHLGGFFSFFVFLTKLSAQSTHNLEIKSRVSLRLSQPGAPVWGIA